MGLEHKFKPSRKSAKIVPESAFFDDAPVLFDVLTAGGTILYANATQTAALGLKPGALNGRSVETLYTSATIQFFKSLFDKARRGAVVKEENVHVSMRAKGHERLDLAASLTITHEASLGPVMRLVKFRTGSALARLSQLESDNDMLSSILATARDATYCVEFIEPVDVTAPEHEVIRQVFENRCRWRYCNEAMSRFYQLPQGEDLNMRDVHEVFPRNPGNEAFVRDLMAHGWQLNAAQSYDHRYDGSDIYVDNDVRAHIVEGRLHRFWGIVRDRSSRILKERQLKTEVSQVLDLLGSTPDPILAVNASGRIEGANPAVEHWLGWPLEECLGTRLDALLRFDTELSELFAAAGTGRYALRRMAIALCKDGSELECDVNLAAIAPASQTPRFVLTLRMELPTRQKPVRTAVGGRR